MIREPLPETPEAIRLGCMCVIKRNDLGVQTPYRDGSNQYCFAKECPVHGGIKG